MAGWILLFFIIGFFVWAFTKKGSSGSANYRDDYLRKSIDEFENILKEAPNKSVKELLQKYKKELGEGSEDAVETDSADTSEHKISFKADKGISWSEWYSRNSINLLLYVGAFLIVASASIFVGFQWESLSGVIKASVLTSVAIAFFGFGTWFYKIPKIRDAGSTFIAIGAVLIPVCGTAWFNFVFKQMGTEPGIVWLWTSVIALSVYAYLAFNYKNKFYTYASSITFLSLVSSMVNTFNLDSDFYILAGIISSFILMLLSFWSRKQEAQIQDYTLVPLQISSQVMMPMALGVGLITALSQDKLFSIEAVVSAILASGFYVLSYLYFKKAYFMAASEVLFSVSVILMFYWQGFDKTILMYLLNFCAFAYLYKASILKRYNLKEEVDITLVVSIAQSVLVLPFAYSLRIDPMHTAFLSLMPAIAGVTVTFIKNDIRYFGISSLSIAVALPLFMANVFKIPHYFDYLGYGYLTVGLIFYAVCVYLRNDGNSKKVFGLSAVLFFFLGFVFGLNVELQRLIISLVLASIAIHYAWVFNLKETIYVSNLLITFALFNLLRLFDINSEVYPLYYSGLAFILYGASFAPLPQGKNFQEPYRTSGLVVAVITPLIGWLSSAGGLFNTRSLVERNSLISAYSSTILYGIDTALRKRPNFGYITSAIGMATFLWQIKYLGVSESLIYTIPLGLYFVALAYSRKIKNDHDGRLLLDIVGLLFLLAPPAYSAFGADSIKFVVTLGISGIALLISGISLRYKLYKIAGVVGIVLAVLPETYTYILNLPRWVVVGIGGILFISVAIFLSLKRKDSK